MIQECPRNWPCLPVGLLPIQSYSSVRFRMRNRLISLMSLFSCLFSQHTSQDMKYGSHMLGSCGFK